MTRLDSVERAVADIAAGKAVVVIDDEERENEGDLIFAAEKATPEMVAFMVRYTSGYLCVPLDGAICDKLGLLPMYAVNQDKHGTAYTVTVDARHGVGTGISASDRATTMRLLADPTSVADNFTRPGHVVPLRAKDGGVSCAGPATPKPPSTWPGWLACNPRVPSAKSSARRTRARWPKPTSCGSSPTNMTLR
jgi:3,4-dihydroxy 2-butanone 4-phosphate synthase/GTP cyclohydrolase II